MCVVRTKTSRDTEGNASALRRRPAILAAGALGLSVPEYFGPAGVSASAGPTVVTDAQPLRQRRGERVHVLEAIAVA